MGSESWFTAAHSQWSANSPGDTLVLYTDGATESFNHVREGQCFTRRTLFVMLVRAPATLRFHFYVRHFASYHRTYDALGDS